MAHNSNLTFDIPADLREADELLTRYGRWACDRVRRRRCGSAEGRYRSPANDDDRQPREVLQPDFEALQCQRTLARVPDVERSILVVLYIPQRMPVELQLRLLRVPPRLCRERHLHGLKMFWSLWRLQALKAV
jgi:hypothetical protein